MTAKTTHIGFVIEQALGHVTHTWNLQAHVPSDPTVAAHWGLIPFPADGIGGRIPLYKSNWTVRAGMRARAALRRLSRETPLDVLFFHTQVTAVLAANWVRRIPSVISLDATPLQFDQLGAAYAHARGPEWLESLKWRLNRDVLRDARQIVTWSAWAKGGLVDGYEVPADKITVIPPGVSVERWRPPTPRQLHDGPVRILFVGGDLERKGGKLLHEAWRRIRASGTSASSRLELHLVTKDDVPAEDGLFVHHGMQPNSDALRQLYHRCDLFCLPTYGDCLPMVLSEAGAAGLPAVSTRVAAIGELVREGETGFLVGTGDVDGLVAAISRLVEDGELRLRLGARAMDVVRAEHDAARNAQRLVELLKDVASAPARTAKRGAA